MGLVCSPQLYAVQQVAYLLELFLIIYFENNSHGLYFLLTCFLDN